MERPPKKYVCEKCGYLGDTSEHEGCDYLAWTTGEQLYIDQLESELALLKASPASTPEVRESVIEAIAEALGDAYDCTRVWSAWSYGTMSQDDFSLIAEDRSRLEEIADAAMLAAAPTPPVSEDRKDAEQAHIAELEQLAHNLGRGLIRWRERTWPGTDQAHVVYREYPALKAIDAARQEDKP